MKCQVSNVSNSRTKSMRAWSIGLATTLLLCACGKVSVPTASDKPVERNWTEDVLLDDGVTMQVKRYVRFNETDAWTGGAYNAVETQSTLAFAGPLENLPTWHGDYIPIVLYHDAQTNEWTIVATTTSCDRWGERGKPMPPYWEFRLDATGWRETPLSGTSKGRRSNLLFEYAPVLEAGHISSADKERIQFDNRSFNSNDRLNDAYRSVAENATWNCR